MNILLLTLLLWTQGIPVQPNQTGTVTGVLRTADGKPAVNERVAAIPQVEFAGDTVGAATLSSLAVTDEQGRYMLENIPPGRYFIAAGRLDLQTFYPGTQAMNAGQPVRVAPGEKVEGISFTLNASSAGRSVSGFAGATLSFVVPMDIRFENGGKLPISSGGKFSRIKLTSVAGAVSVSAPILANGILELPPGGADYRIAFEGLPDDYNVKTIKYGTATITDGLLKISNPVPINPLGGFTTVWSAGAAAATTWVNGLRLAVSGPPPQLLSIVFDTNSSTPASGARVRGTIQGNLQRHIYLSGTPGTVYADGTFEFRNVTPGRHLLMSLDSPPSTSALVASVVVGTEDLNDVEVSRTPALPFNSGTLTAPGLARTSAPGVMPLASLRGRILDAETGAPVSLGTVYVVGDSSTGFALGSDGTFEFQRLLPGNYQLEIQGTGYPTLRREIVVEDHDLDLELKAG
jgi:protocatechuate 3,4-dioxygenase beta subunit